MKYFLSNCQLADTNTQKSEIYITTTGITKNFNWGRGQNGKIL